MSNRPRTSRVWARPRPVALLLLTALPPLAACQRLPVRPGEIADAGPLKSTITGGVETTKQAIDPADLPPLRATPSATDAPKVTPDDAPTPLLDAAIARAEALENRPPEPAIEEPKPSPTRENTPRDETVQPASAELPSAAPVTPKPGGAPQPEAGQTPVELPPVMHPPAPVAVSTLKVDGKPQPPLVTNPTPSREPAPTLEVVPAVARGGWRESLDDLRTLARRRAGGPGEEAEAWALRGRVLDHLAGADDPDGANGRAWTSVLVALSTATGAETVDDALLSVRLAEAIEALEEFAPLKVVAFEVVQKIEGFGNYTTLDPQALRAGQTVLLYCELSGVKYEPADEGFRSRVAARVEVSPVKGGSVLWSQNLDTAEDLCRKRRRDYYVNYRLSLPRTLAPGRYRLRIVETDEVGEREAAGELRFALRGEPTAFSRTR